MKRLLTFFMLCLFFIPEHFVGAQEKTQSSSQPAAVSEDAYYGEDRAATSTRQRSPRRGRRVYRKQVPRAPQQNQAQTLLKRGVTGAAIGAIASGASGGEAGKGAAIGAGTGVIGGALMDAMGGSQGQQQRQAPVYEEEYYEDEGLYEEDQAQPPSRRRVRRRPAPRPAPQQQSDAAGTLLKRGVSGAAIGAISAEASGGKAGKGAAAGAGTAILGGILMDAMGGGQQQAPAQQDQYYEEEEYYYDEEGYEDQGKEIPVRRRRTQ